MTLKLSVSQPGARTNEQGSSWMDSQARLYIAINWHFLQSQWREAGLIKPLWFELYAFYCSRLLSITIICTYSQISSKLIISLQCLLTISKLGPILHHFGDLRLKIVALSCPLSFIALVWANHFEFCNKPDLAKTRATGLCVTDLTFIFYRRTWGGGTVHGRMRSSVGTTDRKDWEPLL